MSLEPLGDLSGGDPSPARASAAWESSPVARLIRELRSRDLELDDLTAENERLRAQLNRDLDVHERTAALTREYRRLEGDLRDREREAAVAHELAELTRTALDRWREEIESLEAREREAVDARELVARELERSRSDAASLGAELGSVRQELQRVRAEFGATRQELQRIRAELDATRLELGAASERLGRAQVEYPARIRELEQTVSTMSVTLREVRGDVERAAASRAWRYGHFFTRTLRRVRRKRIRTEGALARAISRIEAVEGSTTRALPSGRDSDDAQEPLDPASTERRREELPLSPERDGVVARGRADVAARLREALGPAPQRDEWPLVSVLVISRNGHHHLERLINGLLVHTDYPAFELIVLDNGSSDGSAEYLESLDLPFSLTVLASEENLSFSDANRQAAASAAGALLLLMNNDVEAFEKGWLRELVVALDVDGVEAVGATLLHAEAPDSTLQAEAVVQHRGVRFRWQDGVVRAFNFGDGEALWDGPFGIELRSPAVTAACMLVSAETFGRLDGFAPVYRWGTEDVDFGLRLLGAGSQSVGTGRAVLVHRESSTQARETSDFRRVNRLGNRRALLERWGSSLRRDYRLARLRRDPFWTDGAGPHVAITLTSLNQTDGWGDWYTGHELGDALSALGWRVTYVERRGDAWYDLPGDLDYLIALMDSFDLRRLPAHVGAVAWMRNWTDRWLASPWFDRADVLLASSAGSAELIEAATGRPIVHFPLATNPARFSPRETDPRYLADYVFTGNHWGKERDIQRALDPRPDERLRIYGRGWDEVPTLKAHAAGWVHYEELPSIYSSAKLVIDDTQSPTLPYGAVNARVFDALAAGSLVVSNCAAGVRDLFDDDFPTWESPEMLRRELDELLGDDDRRNALIHRYRDVVLRDHTYARRAEQLRSALIEHEQKLRFCVKIGAPSQEAAIRWGDLHFARALAGELGRHGHRTLIQTLDGWEDEEGLLFDVVVHLKGLSRYRPKPGQFNVLWSISHPAELTGEECDGYDLVCVASERFAERLRGMTATPVVVLEQATDPRVFFPDPRPDVAHDLVYVANSRNILRPMLRDLLPTARDLAIWGDNWEGLIDTSLVVDAHVPNDELRHIYSAAGIVLCDHWDDMREHGYVSNRVYDALACGAVVLSDEVTGLSDRFGEAVITYRDAGELEELIDQLLGDPEERARRGERGRADVLAAHTFTHRTEELLAAVEGMIAARGTEASPIEGETVQERSGQIPSAA